MDSFIQTHSTCMEHLSFFLWIYPSIYLLYVLFGNPALLGDLLDFLSPFYILISVTLGFIMILIPFLYPSLSLSDFLYIQSILCPSICLYLLSSYPFSLFYVSYLPTLFPFLALFYVNHQQMCWAWGRVENCDQHPEVSGGPGWEGRCAICEIQGSF